jgi:AraC family transcriptional regulator, arabinose operon regulatory protein
MIHDLPFATLRFTSPPRFFYWERDFHWSPPPLPDFDLWCILEGRGAVQLRGHTHELVPGVCFVLKPGDQPEARHDPAHPLVAFYCHFEPLDPQGRRLLARRVPVPPPAWPMRDWHWFQMLARQCVTAYQRGDALGERQSQRALELLLAQIWEWWQSPPALPADDALVGLIHDIERKPGQLWTVAEMAHRVGLSRAQFTRRFWARTGQSPMTFVIQTRLELARQLIRETTMSLTDIAGELGYQDLYFFSRQFKQRFGRPPSAHRPASNLAPVDPPRSAWR